MNQNIDKNVKILPVSETFFDRINHHLTIVTGISSNRELKWLKFYVETELRHSGIKLLITLIINSVRFPSKKSAERRAGSWRRRVGAT